MKVRDVIQRNFGAKLTSTVLGALIWLSIQTSIQRSSNDSSDEKIKLANPAEGVLPAPPVATLPKEASPPSVGQSEPFKRPVTILREGSDANLYRIEPLEVSVVVQGDRNLLKEMDTKQIKLFVDVADKKDRLLKADSKSIPAQILAHTPAGVSIVEIEPALASIERIQIRKAETETNQPPAKPTTTTNTPPKEPAPEAGRQPNQ